MTEALKIPVICFQPVFHQPEQVIHKFVIRSLKTPQAVELVYLPFYLFIYTVRTLSLLGRQAEFQGIMLVDLVQGEPMAINRQTAIEGAADILNKFPGFKNVTNIKNRNKINFKATLIQQEVVESHLLPASLQPAQAIDRARNIFKYDLWRLAGGFRFRKVEIIPDFEGLTVYYPIWLVYYSKKGQMSFKAYDGLTLEKVSGNFLLAIKKALLYKHHPELKPKEET